MEIDNHEHTLSLKSDVGEQIVEVHPDEEKNPRISDEDSLQESIDSQNMYLNSVASNAAAM